MKQATLLAGIILLCLVIAIPVANAGRQEEAKALVEKAVAMVKEKGMDATLKAINDRKGPFVKGDLYIFALTLELKVLATGSPYSKPLLGTVSKTSFAPKLVEIAKKQGSGWLEYSYPKPNEKEPSPKKSYIMRLPGKDVFFGCGYYLK